MCLYLNRTPRRPNNGQHEGPAQGLPLSGNDTKTWMDLGRVRRKVRSRWRQGRQTIADNMEGFGIQPDGRCGTQASAAGFYVGGHAQGVRFGMAERLGQQVKAVREAGVTGARRGWCGRGMGVRRGWRGCGARTERARKSLADGDGKHAGCALTG